MTTLCYFGHHKCATQWISRVCHQVTDYAGIKFDYLDFYATSSPNLGKYIDSRKVDFLAYANAHPVQVLTLESFRGFHVVRDPRDLIISAYYSHKMSHHSERWPELRAHRKRLNEVPIDEGLFLEIDFCRALITRGIEIGLLSSIQNWDYEQDNVLELKFEELVSDPLTVFSNAFDFLGLLSDQEGLAFLDGCLQRLSFERLSGGRTMGNEDTASHYRKGSAGEWKQFFSAEHLDYFNAEFGNLAARLGYASE